VKLLEKLEKLGRSLDFSNDFEQKTVKSSQETLLGQPDALIDDFPHLIP
jgi:hypothetical protein